MIDLELPKLNKIELNPVYHFWWLGTPYRINQDGDYWEVQARIVGEIAYSSFNTPEDAMKYVCEKLRPLNITELSSEAKQKLSKIVEDDIPRIGTDQGYGVRHFHCDREFYTLMPNKGKWIVFEHYSGTGWGDFDNPFDAIKYVRNYVKVTKTIESSCI